MIGINLSSRVSDRAMVKLGHRLLCMLVVKELLAIECLLVILTKNTRLGDACAQRIEHVEILCYPLAFASKR